MSGAWWAYGRFSAVQDDQMRAALSRSASEWSEPKGGVRPVMRVSASAARSAIVAGAGAAGFVVVKFNSSGMWAAPESAPIANCAERVGIEQGR